MNLLPRDMHEMEVLVLQVPFPPQYLPCKGDIDIRQILVICFENKVSIIQEVLELLNTIIDGIAFFLPGGPVQLSALESLTEIAIHAHFAISDHKDIATLEVPSVKEVPSAEMR